MLPDQRPVEKASRERGMVIGCRVVVEHIQIGAFSVGLIVLLHGMIRSAMDDHKLVSYLKQEDDLCRVNPFIGHPFKSIKIHAHPEKYLTDEGVTLYNRSRRLWLWHCAIVFAAIAAVVILEGIK